METKFLNSKIKKFKEISNWISNLEYSIFRALTEQVLVDDVEADEEASYLTDPFLNLAIIDIFFSDFLCFQIFLPDRDWWTSGTLENIQAITSAESSMEV